MVEVLKTVLLSVESPLCLKAPLLGAHPGAQVRLDSKCVVTFVDSEGNPSSKSLLELDTRIFLSIVEEATRELIKLASAVKTDNPNGEHAEAHGQRYAGARRRTDFHR